jgi:hypothetical protein
MDGCRLTVRSDLDEPSEAQVWRRAKKNNQKRKTVVDGSYLGKKQKGDAIDVPTTL